MTDRTQQLLLEILLIQHRYTSQEVQRVSHMLRERAFEPAILQVIELLEHLSLSSAKRPKRAQASEADPNEAKERFFQGLRTPRSSNDGRRLKAIAKRLRLEAGGLGPKQLIERIRAEVNRMDDRELRSFLKPYRLEKPADEGYVGLANYLMHNE